MYNIPIRKTHNNSAITITTLNKTNSRGMSLTELSERLTTKAKEDEEGEKEE